MRPAFDIRDNPEAPLYAAGAGFVVFKDGSRQDRNDCERLREYHQRVIADKGRGGDSHERARVWLAQLDAAISESWPEQKGESNDAA